MKMKREVERGTKFAQAWIERRTQADVVQSVPETVEVFPVKKSNCYISYNNAVSPPINIQWWDLSITAC